MDGPVVSPGSTMPMGGYAPPGLASTSYSAAGFGAHQGMMVSQLQGASLAGGAMVGGEAARFMGQTVPAVMGGGLMLGSALAPMIAAGAGEGPMGRGLGMAARGFSALDPFNYVFRGGVAGFRAGGAVGGALGRMAGPAMGGAGWAGGAAMGGLMGAAMPAMAGMAALGGISYAGGQVMQGSSNQLAGQALLSTVGRSATGRPMSAGGISGMGAGIGQDMQSAAWDMGTDTDTIGRMVQELDQQKMFQTTKSIQEFRTRFREVLSTIKDIARITQSTIKEASQTFAEIRQQGFYSTADVESQAVRQRGIELSTGLSRQTVTAVGAVGSQMGRAMGMRGRFGARMAQEAVASVSAGVQAGTMSEEEVMEMGGVEQAGMRLAQSQMRFMRSSRGRAVIAATMGSGRAPGGQALQDLMGGAMSVEDIVNRASTRGLGTLMASGTREARENFSPYAGMAMVSTAMAQQRQLYGGVTQSGTVNMLRTMGMGNEEARLMLQQTSGLGQRVQDQRSGEILATQRAEFEERARQHSLTGRATRFTRGLGAGTRAGGAYLTERASARYQQATEYFSGYREFGGGDSLDLAKEHYGQGRGLGGGAADVRGVLEGGGPTESAILRKRYSEYARSERFDGPNRGGIDLGGGEYIDRWDIQHAEGLSKLGYSPTQRATLGRMLREGSLQQRVGSASGGTGLDETAYFLAKQFGSIDPDLSFDDYMGASDIGGRPGRDVRFQQRDLVGREMSRYRGSTAEGLVAEAGGLGSLNVRNLGEARRKFGDEISSKMKQLLKGTGWIWDQSGDLGSQLASDGKKRTAFMEFMQALSSKDPERVNRAFDKISGMVGMGERKDLQNIMTRASTGEITPEQLAEFGAGGRIRSQFGRIAAAELSAPQMQIEQQGIAALRRDEGILGGFEGGVSDLEDALSSGDPLARSAALGGMFKKAAAGGFSSQEESFFTKLTGGHRGTSNLMGGVDALLGARGKGKRMETLAERFGLTGSAAEDIAGAGTPERMLEKLFEKLGHLLPELMGASGDGTSVEGMRTKYVESNTQFVRSVHEFTTAISKTPLGWAAGLSPIDAPSEMTDQ